MLRRLVVMSLALSVALLPAAADGATRKRPPVTRDVLFVGNNWDGTADVIQPRRFGRLARINIIPDIDERMAEIQSDPERLGYFLAIREQVGEGHDQFVDDMFSSHNGRVLYVSRPSLADVVAINLRTRKIIWRTKVDGNRADHMAISPDGRHVLVSASTAKVVDVIDTRTGAIVARIPSGDQPHENNFSKDGKLVYHASIGTVFTPLDDPAFDATKGERVFEIIDASNWQVLRKIDMGKKLDEFGEPDMSGAVRPMALTPDERLVYFQVSFFHGFVEYDLQQDRVLRLAHLPLSDEAKQKSRQDYLLDSAHHGLAMNPSGTKLCAAGTMSDYAAIVTRSLVRLQDHQRRAEALLGHQQQARQLLLRVGERRRRGLGHLLPQGQADRPHQRGRPPAAHAHGQGPRGPARDEEASAPALVPRRRDTGRAMSEENLVLARNAVAAFNRRDVPALVELTTDDFQWVTWTGTVEPTVYEGADGLAAYFQDADVWEVLNLDVEEFRDLGDEVLVVGTFHARGGGSGVEVRAPYYSAFSMSEGKLARVLSFRTEEEALDAVGLSE